MLTLKLLQPVSIALLEESKGNYQINCVLGRFIAHFL